MTFKNFVRVFAGKEHPLVIFIDDLQWADPESLQLLQALSTGIPHFLLIGSYRDNEVTPTHPLITATAEMEGVGATVRRIRLDPLSLPQVVELVIETLNCNKEKCLPLAELLFQKTAGNPLFLTQLLKTLFEENYLYYDTYSESWNWDPGAICQMPGSDNVLDLIDGKIRKLPAKAQDLIEVAACIGDTFRISDLSAVNSEEPAQISHGVEILIKEGLIFSPGYHGGIITPGPMEDAEPEYRFAHDRVWQAAYNLLATEEKKRLHLKLGRLLLEKITPDELNDKIFTVVDHLNAGAELITDPEEKVNLSEYNLLAGKKAKKSAAYASALNYFRTGISMLEDEDYWTRNRRLTYDLYLERAQCEYLCSNFEAAEYFFDQVLAHTDTCLEEATIYGLKAVLNANLGQHIEAIALVIRGLRRLGLKIPLNPGKIRILKEFLRTKWNLRGLDLEQLAQLPKVETMSKK